MEHRFLSHTQEETKEFGSFLSPFLKPGDVILLKGDLGAGKTTFVNGVGKGLQVQDDVLSPTFNIMKCYFDGRIPMYHIDAYRLEGQNIELGLEEYIEGDGVCLIEWPDFIAPLLPPNPLSITIHNRGDNLREINVSGEGEHWGKVIANIKEKFHD